MRKPQLALQAALLLGSAWTIPQAQGASQPCEVNTEWMRGGNYATMWVGGRKNDEWYGLDALVDTGSSNVSVDLATANKLLHDGNATLGKTLKYRLADGSVEEEETIIIAEIQMVGRACNVEAANVVASVATQHEAENLLGLSFLNRFPSYTFRKDWLIVTKP